MTITNGMRSPLTHQEKTAYISGVLDGATLLPECRLQCKELLLDLVLEIDQKELALVELRSKIEPQGQSQ
jgi:hypothetical protein